MKVKDLILKLKCYDENIEVKVVAENELHLPAEVKIVLKDKYDVLNHSKKNIEYIVIGW
jgi:hypothetical protein